VRLTGNRIVDVGPQSAVGLSGGVLVGVVVGRLQIVNNEVRRASVPAKTGDMSPWGALFLGLVFGDASVRGNLIEAFGRIPAALLLGSNSCIFTENQCFVDNPGAPSFPSLAVLLGLSSGTTNAGAIVASNNFVQTQLTPGPAPIVMKLNPKDVNKTLTVVGNISSGDIQASGGPLPGAWIPLNVRSI